MEEDDMVTVKEAALLLGISRTKLYDLMGKGLLVPATERNPMLDRPRRHVFRRGDLLAYKAERIRQAQQGQ